TTLYFQSCSHLENLHAKHSLLKIKSIIQCSDYTLPSSACPPFYLCEHEKHFCSVVFEIFLLFCASRPGSKPRQVEA
ncbi:Uncharacterized protein APZ42_009928, partial [Daphnia magna]